MILFADLIPKAIASHPNDQGAEAPQVGLLSKDFKPQPGVASTQAWGNETTGLGSETF